MAHRRVHERWGDEPRWLKVIRVRRGRLKDGTRANELIVRIRNKDYWFPASDAAMRKFVSLGYTTNRGRALRWFRRYIRKHKGYKGVWPDLTYYRKNRIPDDRVYSRRGTFGSEERPAQESAVSDDFTVGKIISITKNYKRPSEVTNEVKLPTKTISTILNMYKAGYSPMEIHRRVGVKLSDVVKTIELLEAP